MVLSDRFGGANAESGREATRAGCGAASCTSRQGCGWTLERAHPAQGRFRQGALFPRGRPHLVEVRDRGEGGGTPRRRSVWAR